MFINEIVKAYVQQFNQESVLQVVDEDVKVSFITGNEATSVSEPTPVLSLISIGIAGTLIVLKKKLKIRKIAIKSILRRL